MSPSKATWCIFLVLEIMWLVISVASFDVVQILHSLSVMCFFLVSYGWIERMEEAELSNEELSWNNNHESLDKTDEGQKNSGVSLSSSSVKVS